MLKSNIINNVDIDKLPEPVQEQILTNFDQLTLQQKLIVYSRLTHGNLFKSEQTDLFKVNKVSVAKVYDQFLQELKASMTR